MATSPYGPVSDRSASLARIDAIVTVYLGPARVKGNAQPAVFNRQLAMYLAKHVGRWSTTRIGRFYNGRGHSTVCHAIREIEALRSTDPKVAQMLEVLTEGVLESATDQSAKQPERIAGSHVVGGMRLEDGCWICRRTKSWNGFCHIAVPRRERPVRTFGHPSTGRHSTIKPEGL